MATYLKYENGALVPDEKNCPSVQCLLNSAKKHLSVNRMLDKKRNVSNYAIIFTILVLVVAAIDTWMTISVALWK